MPVTPRTEIIHVRVTEAMYLELARVSGDRDETISSLIRTFVRDGLRDFPLPDGRGLSSLKDAA
jgi:hypothetical protein